MRLNRRPDIGCSDEHAVLAGDLWQDRQRQEGRRAGAGSVETAAPALNCWRAEERKSALGSCAGHMTERGGGEEGRRPRSISIRCSPSTELMK
ncbi:hypothetical protein SRHO_G00165010 [Serrasalmus rhombeus]